MGLLDCAPDCCPVVGSEWPSLSSLGFTCPRLPINHGIISLERASVLSAGITISKHRNRLKADIVEALQCLKCLIKRDLLFRDTDDPSVAAEIMGERQPDVPEDGSGWDALVEDLEDDECYEVDDSDEIRLLSLDNKT